MASLTRLYEWNLAPREAVALQRELSSRVRLETPPRIETIAGCDVSFNKFSETIYAGIVVISLASLETLEEVAIETQTRFPYVAGLLSFRELPAVLEAWQKLHCEPDAVMFDGQGLAHPRRLGIACHAGLWLERPTFGCAKSLLVGKYDEPDKTRGAWSPLMDKGETVGAALRTKNKTNPVFVSPGHLMTLEAALDLTLRCDGGYRVPEPTRRAHNLVNAVRRGERPEENLKLEL